jgi:hypothetical protein
MLGLAPYVHAAGAGLRLDYLAFVPPNSGSEPDFAFAYAIPKSGSDPEFGRTMME